MNIIIPPMHVELIENSLLEPTQVTKQRSVTMCLSSTKHQLYRNTIQAYYMQGDWAFKT